MRKNIFTLAIIISFLVGCVGEKKAHQLNLEKLKDEKKEVMKHQYELELASSNNDFEVWINNIPAAKHFSNSNSTTFANITKFVIEGTNDIQITVLKENANASYEVKIKRLEEGKEIILKTITEKKKNDKFEGPTNLQKWYWQSAEEVNLQDKEIIAFIENSIELFKNKDITKLLELSSVTRKENALIYKISEEEFKSSEAEAFSEEFNHPEFKIEIIPSTSWNLRLVANKKMIECIANDGRPIIRARKQKDGSTFMFAMMIGKLNGIWTILN